MKTLSEKIKESMDKAHKHARLAKIYLDKITVK
jgi:hypothetical protein